MNEKISDKYLQLAAQAWCEPESSSVEMNARLATAFARLLQRADVSGQERMRERCMRASSEIGSNWAADIIRAMPVEE